MRDMPLELKNPKKEVDRIVHFLKNTYGKQRVKRAVIAVSGGIDSALSLTLLTKAIGPKNVHPLFLPHHGQPYEDGEIVCAWNRIPRENIFTVNIGETADRIAETLEIPKDNVVRRGNVMARTRMIAVYDTAKKLGAMVCGTENKSEKYLGYFTRFGDEASDIEPIQHLYKTQVKQLAVFLGIPKEIIDKSPSAGLWDNQTDENELGYTYEEADKVIDAYIANGNVYAPVDGIPEKTAKAVIARIQSQNFKHHVPYTV